MIVKFWGVRGSIPSPVTPAQVQAKITAAIQRITQNDIKSPDSREKFIANLPSWIFGTTGGNTSCVELTSKDGTKILLDAGSGLREYGKKGKKPKDLHYHMIFSHFHWDHIQGLPFFDAAYNPKSVIDMYSAFENFEDFLRSQQKTPFFPPSAGFDSFTKNITFHKVSPFEPFKIGNLDVNLCKMNHPGSSYSFSFEENGKKFVYATDVEIQHEDLVIDEEKSPVFKDADVLVLDSQYTVEESYKKVNWGHSAFCSAIDFAVKWNVKTLYLFHHEPVYDDKKLDSILTAARWCAKYIVHSDLKVFLSCEGLEFEV